MESQMEAPGTRTSAPTVRPVTARNIVNIVLEGLERLVFAFCFRAHVDVGRHSGTLRAML